jgi:antitoxin PrlF
MTTATLTSKGQITIPKAVRDSLRLHSGDKIAFVMHDEKEAVMKPVTKTVDQVFGRLHKAGQVGRSVDELNRAVRQRMRDERS